MEAKAAGAIQFCIIDRMLWERGEEEKILEKTRQWCKIRDYFFPLYLIIKSSTDILVVLRDYSTVPCMMHTHVMNMQTTTYKRLPCERGAGARHRGRNTPHFSRRLRPPSSRPGRRISLSLISRVDIRSQARLTCSVTTVKLEPRSHSDGSWTSKSLRENLKKIKTVGKRTRWSGTIIQNCMKMTESWISLVQFYFTRTPPEGLQIHLDAYCEHRGRDYWNLRG